ncbi:MAG TPA: 6-pyruvoyl-tetrahydropterin synthase-related protein [Chloroflexia bacterium]|nr:6-pyruvoyl-tetrahydropterin synthase-related protein [Chloroflexia bacterium]
MTQLSLRRHLPTLAFAVGLAVASVTLLFARWQLFQPPPITLDLGNPATHASHFYNVEKSGEVGFRWSHSLAAVSLPALASSQVVSITLNPARPDEATLPSFRLLIDNQPIGEFRTQPGWNTYTATVGPRFFPDVRLVIESDSFFPSENDTRRLGMAVSEVSTAPQPGRLNLTWPPRLWLLLAVLAPILGLLWGRVWSSRSGWIAGGAASTLPTLWSLLAPTQFALPVAAWVVGLATLALLLYWSYDWSRRWYGPFAWLTRVASSRWELPAVALFLLTLTLVMTWPLATRLRDTMPGWPGDNFAFLYKLWWFRTALLVTHQSPLFDPNSYAPFGFSLGQGEPTFLNTIPGVPIGALFGDVASYNLLTILSFVISGLGAYLLVREISGSKGAALLASVAFAFCAYRMAHYPGHLQQLGTGWIALTFYFLERTLKTRSIRHGVLMGLCLALTALGTWYYAYMVGLAVAIYAIVRLWTMRREVSIKSLLRPALAGIAVLAVVAGPAALPSLELWRQGGLTHSAKAADEFSASPTDYLIPNQLQPVWGELSMRAQSERPIHESSLYLGLIPVAIALTGWALSRRQRAKDSRQDTQIRNPKSEIRNPYWPVWSGLLALIVVLSLGLTLHGPQGQVQWTMAGGSTPIPLPGRILYDWFPFYSSMRVYARFGILAALAVVVLMGLGWVALREYGNEWVRRNGKWLVVPAMCLLLSDLWTAPFQWGSSRVEPTETSKYLAAAPPGSVMQFPLSGTLSAPAQSGPALWWSTYYRKPITYGYDTFEPIPWRASRPVLEEFPDSGALDLLREWGVRYIVVSANGYQEHWQGTYEYLKSRQGLKHLADFQERRTWDVDPAILDARPDLEEYALSDTQAVFELLP